MLQTFWHSGTVNTRLSIAKIIIICTKIEKEYMRIEGRRDYKFFEVYNAISYIIIRCSGPHNGAFITILCLEMWLLLTSIIKPNCLSIKENSIYI
jgi:hypothetical protein